MTYEPIVSEEASKKFTELAEHAKEFIYKYGHPHCTIVITQRGIEMSEGLIFSHYSLEE